MAASRLRYALASGALRLPESGEVLLLNPPAEPGLAEALPAARCEAVQGFFPAHRALARMGFRATCRPDRARYAAAVVFLPRSKAEGRGLIHMARALCPEGPLWVDGQKSDGIDSILRALRKGGARMGEVIAKAHGKLFSFAGPVPGSWAAAEAPPIEGFRRVSGVFSADGPDPGSRLLAAALPGRMRGRVCDLGAGWGYLGAAVLRREGVEECVLLEAQHAALECARRNISDPRARFVWGDALEFRDAEGFDHVVTNPPFHEGRAARSELGRGFIAAAAALLRPRGQLWLVANRHLPYEKELSARFARHEEIGGDRAYKLIRAERGRAPARAAPGRGGSGGGSGGGSRGCGRGASRGGG